MQGLSISISNDLTGRSSGSGIAVSLLLDTYTGAGFAYSFRRIRSAYSGNNIRARESSGSTEQNIGFTAGVLDSSSLLTFTGSNDGLVPIEYDQSTNGNNLTQTTAANQLKIVDAGSLITSNSLAATQGSSSTGGETSSIAFSGMTDIWLFAVVDIINTSTTQVLYESSTNFNQNAGAFGMFIQSGRLEIANRYSGGAAMLKRYNISTGRQVISIRLRAGVDVNTFSELYINGVTASTHSTAGSGTSVFSDQVLYLNARAGTSIGFTGKRQASIFYPSDQSSNRVGIETNMMDYYGFLFLDRITDAQAAFSLRKLRAAYSGSAIRVRRSSDNAEQDIGFTSGDLDTTSLATFVGANSGYVTTWYDQSGNGYDASNASASVQPKIVDAGSLITSGGKAAIEFAPSSGANGVRLFTGSFGAISQPVTTFAVAETTDATDSTKVILDGASNPFFLARDSTYEIGAGSTLGNSVTDIVAPRLWYGLYNGVSSELGYNDVSTTTGNAGTNALDGLSIGNIRSLIAPNYAWVGTIQEVILYPSNKSSDRTTANGLINAYYGIY